jgi:AAA+ superfamily predicted ATPase
MHEATRRVLSVILQKLEGFEGSSKSTLICATNRLQDLDAALLSRFQLTIRFDLPGREERASVFERYAKTLNKEEIRQLAASSHNMSCRDIKEICEHAERRWASLLIRGKVTNPVPDLQTYAGCLEEKAKGTFGNISAA